MSKEKYICSMCKRTMLTSDGILQAGLKIDYRPHTDDEDYEDFFDLYPELRNFYYAVCPICFAKAFGAFTNGY